MKVKVIKLVYLGLSILENSKIFMHEFWYDYIKPKCQDVAKLCYMDTDSFNIWLKLKMFMKMMMLKKYLIHQIKMSKDHCLQEIIKEWLG